MTANSARTVKLDPKAYEELAAAEAAFKELQQQWVLKRFDLIAKCEVTDEQGNLTQEAFDLRAAVIRSCTEDIFFFFDFFAWCDNADELGDDQEIPLIMFKSQRDLVHQLIQSIRETQGSIKRINELIEKSREMGVSWIVIYIALWFLFFHKAKILIGSRKEEEVDKKGDIDTPFEKIRFAVRRLPLWLLPAGFDVDKNTGERLIKNPQGGQIVGESACENFGRGGRALFGILDEFPTWENDKPAFKATAQTCKVRIVIGTPLGPNNLFADIANGQNDSRFDIPKANIRRVHWSTHPVKAAGMRRLPTGGITSPWYEAQKETMSDEDIASELDINYDKSLKGKVFPDFTEKHLVFNLMPLEESKIIRVWDPGKTFCVLWLQIDRWHRVLALKELIVEDARIHDVAQEVLRISEDPKGIFRGFEFEDYGDPSGGRRQNAAQMDPEYEMLLEYDIDVDYMFLDEMPTKLRVKSRIQAIHNKLREYESVNDTLGLLVDRDRCPRLVEAFKGKYRYKIDKRTGDTLEMVDEVHPWEDVMDCLGMGILAKLGLGLKKESPKVVPIEKGSVTWNRQRRRR